MAGLAAERFRKRRENSEPATGLPQFGAHRRRVVEFGIGSRHQPLEILSQLMRQRAVGNAVQIGGSLSVKLLQSFSLFLIQPAIWPAFQCREQRFQVSPPWQ